MKKLFPIILISILAMQSLQAQGDSTEYEHRPFQFTFLFPPLSTNGAKNAHIVNDVSLNLFIGVSGGVEAFEAATFINIDQYYVDGVQLAGFGNTVGGHVSGAQLAGFYNVTGRDVQGVQGAGFVNVAGRDVNGLQGAGFVNVAGSHMKGAQAAGFVNVAGDSLEGFQGAGFINIAGASKKGIQAASFGNVAGGGRTYFQGAGFFNVAEEVKGAQLAGFINVAGNVKGTQLAGLLNICDSIDGVPLAFISVVKKNGYRKFGFNISETQYANLTFKMGVKHLYNIYSFGKPFGPGSRWMFGGGLGTEFDLTEKMMLNIEGTVHQELWIGNMVNPYFLYIDRLNLYNSLKFLFGWNMDNKVDIHIGPTFNVSVAHTNPDMGQLDWNEIAPYSFYNQTNNTYKQTNVQMWVGLQGSISF
ncbi:MAG: hypothetical protein KAS82_08680 [Bacteroidales bacterium]|nr:hypothetical protein [Bacteroidales bacterium]